MVELIHEDEVDARCRILYHAPEIFRGVSLNVEERDDDRQHDHLFDHKESGAAMDDHQVSGWATLSELQMITRATLRSVCLMFSFNARLAISAAYGRDHEETREKYQRPSHLGGVMANKPWFLESPSRQLGDRPVGAGYPVYITGEIGINHNGDLTNAIALIDQAADAGCDAVKFQKRTPEICTPA